MLAGFRGGWRSGAAGYDGFDQQEEVKRNRMRVTPCKRRELSWGRRLRG